MARRIVPLHVRALPAKPARDLGPHDLLALPDGGTGRIFAYRRDGDRVVLDITDVASGEHVVANLGPDELVSVAAP